MQRLQPADPDNSAMKAAPVVTLASKQDGRELKDSHPQANRDGKGASLHQNEIWRTACGEQPGMLCGAHFQQHKTSCPLLPAMRGILRTPDCMFPMEALDNVHLKAACRSTHQEDPHKTQSTTNSTSV